MPIYMIIVILVITLILTAWVYEILPRRQPNVLALKNGDIENVLHVWKHEKELYIFLLRKNKEIKIYCGIIGDNIDPDDENLRKGRYMIKRCNRGFFKNLVYSEGKRGQYYISFMPA